MYDQEIYTLDTNNRIIYSDKVKGKKFMVSNGRFSQNVKEKRYRGITG